MRKCDVTDVCNIWKGCRYGEVMLQMFAIWKGGCYRCLQYMERWCYRCLQYGKVMLQILQYGKVMLQMFAIYGKRNSTFQWRNIWCYNTRSFATNKVEYERVVEVFIMEATRSIKNVFWPGWRWLVKKETFVKWTEQSIGGIYQESFV